MTAASSGSGAPTAPNAASPTTMPPAPDGINPDDFDLEHYQFGGPVARQMGAEMDYDEDDYPKQQIAAEEEEVDEDDEKLRESAKLPDYHEKLEGMDFDERVEATMECLQRRNSFRHILYGLLGFCMEEKSYEEIEPYVEDFVDFDLNHQEPRRYVYMLLRTGALLEIELKEDGTPLTEEDKQAAIDDGLDPEDVDTLVYDWRVVTTDVGQKVYEDFSPTIRLQQLIAEDPGREEAFAELMTFLITPRSFGAIDEEYKGKELLGFDENTRQKRQPSSYIDKLDQAGAVAWNGETWSLTDVGKDYLDSRDTDEEAAQEEKQATA